MCVEREREENDLSSHVTRVFISSLHEGRLHLIRKGINVGKHKPKQNRASAFREALHDHCKYDNN
jgi:hypothetical protein